MKLPVLFIVFNRPDTTERVFDAIARYQPTQLFVAADGPRSNRVDDAPNCDLTRKIATSVTWDCTLTKLFQEKNLGCNEAVTKAISWFFEHVEEGIILEDDCLPTQDFFRFCEEMIVRYRDEESVMHITGDNFQFGVRIGNGSYYFSRIPHVWGWATWKRAWQKFDLKMNDFGDFRHRADLTTFFNSEKSKKHWMYFFRRAFMGTSTWDYVWTYTVMKNKGRCIIPNANLISNIGFGKNATVAKDATSILANLATQSLEQPTVHPSLQEINEEGDDRFLNNSPEISPLKIWASKFPPLTKLIYRIAKK